MCHVFAQEEAEQPDAEAGDEVSFKGTGEIFDVDLSPADDLNMKDFTQRYMDVNTEEQWREVLGNRPWNPAMFRVCLTLRLGLKSSEL